MKTISISTAVDTGTLLVNVPVFFFLMSGFWMQTLFEEMGTFPKEYGWLNYASFGIGFVVGWLWWSITIPIWRIWAYQRVDNIAELKEHAIRAQLIWPDGSIFERTEIKTKKLIALEKKLGK